MSTPGAHENDLSEAVPSINCDRCGESVAETATDVVPRRYMSVVIDERWCLLCIKAKNEATERALRINQNDEPDY